MSQACIAFCLAITGWCAYGMGIAACTSNMWIFYEKVDNGTKFGGNEGIFNGKFNDESYVVGT